MAYWLLKTDAGAYSIDDLKKDAKTAWTGVRNYQARNFMRDMQVGDQCLFYHSGSSMHEKTKTVAGVYGLAKVVAQAHDDPSQFDKKDAHFDPKATKEKPIWQCVDIAFVKKCKEPIGLDEIKGDPALEGMGVRQRGSRLSVQPVSPKHFERIFKIAERN